MTNSSERLDSVTTEAPPRKSFIALESNPDVFSDLLHNLGAPDVNFYDVFSLDDAELLSLVPGPALALVLVCPTSDAYEKQKAMQESARIEYTGSGPDEDVIWFKQTIHNACGFYAILHAISNAREYIQPNTILARLLDQCIPSPPHIRASHLENSTELEKVYKAAAIQGQSAIPEDAAAEVNFHYIAFVRSRVNGRLYELDGDRKGPRDLGVYVQEEKDLLEDESVRNIVRKYMEFEDGGDIGFNLMALVPTTSNI